MKKLSHLFLLGVIAGGLTVGIQAIEEGDLPSSGKRKRMESEQGQRRCEDVVRKALPEVVKMGPYPDGARRLSDYFRLYLQSEYGNQDS